MNHAALDRSLARKLLEDMAALQAEHNSAVDPAWRTAGLAYYRAIWVECAELLDHFGWKWWKHQVCDEPQVRLELVDIWHFGLLLKNEVIFSDDVKAIFGEREGADYLPDSKAFLSDDTSKIIAEEEKTTQIGEGEKNKIEDKDENNKE